MQKIALYASVAIVSSLLTLGASASASLMPKAATTASSTQSQLELARHGADDGNRNDHHGRGHDDGANHAANTPAYLLMARHGADDAAGHDRHGRGADDAPGDDHGGRRG
jgi:hypothetical protein